MVVIAPINDTAFYLEIVKMFSQECGNLDAVKVEIINREVNCLMQ